MPAIDAETAKPDKKTANILKTTSVNCTGVKNESIS
jgi:hypothetical protein